DSVLPRITRDSVLLNTETGCLRWQPCVTAKKTSDDVLFASQADLLLQIKQRIKTKTFNMACEILQVRAPDDLVSSIYRSCPSSTLIYSNASGCSLFPIYMKPSHTIDDSYCEFIHPVPKPSYTSSTKHLREAQMEPFPRGLASPNQIKLMILLS
ncbi:hypothetical protein STEG23_024763, partial [Scotinomys teguina]